MQLKPQKEIQPVGGRKNPEDGGRGTFFNRMRINTAITGVAIGLAVLPMAGCAKNQAAVGSAAGDSICADSIMTAFQAGRISGPDAVAKLSGIKDPRSRGPSIFSVAFDYADSARKLALVGDIESALKVQELPTNGVFDSNYVHSTAVDAYTRRLLELVNRGQPNKALGGIEKLPDFADQDAIRSKVLQQIGLKNFELAWSQVLLIEHLEIRDETRSELLRILATKPKEVERALCLCEKIVDPVLREDAKNSIRCSQSQ